jgi:hypothetical protein
MISVCIDKYYRQNMIIAELAIMKTLETFQ